MTVLLYNTGGILLNIYVSLKYIEMKMELQ